MLDRQIDYFLIPNDDSIRIPKFILVMIEPFIVRTAIRTFYNVKTPARTLPIRTISAHELHVLR